MDVEYVAPVFDFDREGGYIWMDETDTQNASEMSAHGCIVSEFLQGRICMK